jgi:hypothetical protein
MFVASGEEVSGTVATIPTSHSSRLFAGWRLNLMAAFRHVIVRHDDEAVRLVRSADFMLGESTWAHEGTQC